MATDGGGEPHLRRDDVRVLLVDDDEDLRGLLSHVLRAEGFLVDVGHDGREAVERLGAEPCPDVVVIDVMMPRLTGFEVREHVRASTHLQHLPIVLMTATGFLPAERRELEVDKNTAVIFKPFGVPELLDAVNQKVSAMRAR